MKASFHPVSSVLPTVLLTALLAGCASTERLRDVRELAAESSKLSGYTDMSVRFRDTYAREQPYLSPAGDERERALDTVRRQQYADCVSIAKSVALYLDTLAVLAGEQQYDLSDQVQRLSSGIKAWPDTGLVSSHVNAYAELTALLARTWSAPRQQQAVQAMVHAGQAPLQQLLAAMTALLRYYDKTNANEKAIVLGMLQVEIAYADTPANRLLAALGKAQQQSKTVEYHQAELTYRLAEKNLATIAQAQQALLQYVDQLDSAPARAALEQASQQLRLNRAELHHPSD